MMKRSWLYSFSSWRLIIEDSFLNKSLLIVRLTHLKTIDLNSNHGIITARNIVNVVDADKDGRIQYDEFKAAVFKAVALEKDQLISSAF